MKEINELAAILDRHARWLTTGIGERADLRGAALQGANLRGVNLESANLEGANLQKAIFWRANLQNANLQGANLQGAHLWRADLAGADLYGADLREANLEGANLQRAILQGADLQGADIRGANLYGAILEKANLILIGQDVRGYLFYASKNKDGVVEIHAGCRHFVGISAARNHWQNRHSEDAVLHADCLSLIDRCETMAKVRGWKLEPEGV